MVPHPPLVQLPELRNSRDLRQDHQRQAIKNNPPLQPRRRRLRLILPQHVKCLVRHPLRSSRPQMASLLAHSSEDATLHFARPLVILLRSRRMRLPASRIVLIRLHEDMSQCPPLRRRLILKERYLRAPLRCQHLLRRLRLQTPRNVPRQRRNCFKRRNTMWIVYTHCSKTLCSR